MKGWTRSLLFLAALAAALFMLYVSGILLPTYRMQIMVDGAGQTSPELGIHRYRPGQDVELRVEPAAGFDFVRWHTNAGHLGDETAAHTVLTMPGRDVFITAQLVRDRHTVTFRDWDDDILEVQEVAHGTPAVPPVLPQRDGYLFLRWEPSIEYVTASLDVSPRYESRVYEITFRDWDGRIIQVQMVPHGGEADPPEPRQREGYDFVGWNADLTDITSRGQVTAQYEAVEHRVEFVDWDGQVLDVQSVSHGQSPVLPEEPTRPGYEFRGWSVTPDRIESALTIQALYAEEPPELAAPESEIIADDPLEELFVDLLDDMLPELDTDASPAETLPEDTQVALPEPEGIEDSDDDLPEEFSVDLPDDILADLETGELPAGPRPEDTAVGGSDVGAQTGETDHAGGIAEPTVDEPAMDEPAMDEPAMDEPVIDDPVVEEPVVDDDDPFEAAAPTVEADPADDMPESVPDEPTGTAYPVSFFSTPPFAGTRIRVVPQSPRSVGQLASYETSTGPGGLAAVDLPSGEYSFSAVAEGYEEYAGSFHVRGSGRIVEFNLTQRQASIGGTVRDAQTREPLERAGVVLYRGESTAIMDVVVATTTNPDGDYSLRDVPAGQYTVRVRLIGYETEVVFPVVVQEGARQTLEVLLEPDGF